MLQRSPHVSVRTGLRTLLQGVVVAGLALLAAPTAHAQAVLGTYTFASALGSEPTFPVDTQPANATFSPMRRGSGLVPAASTGRFSATGFTVDSVAIDTAQYFAFRVTAASGFELLLDSLTFTERRSGTGIHYYQVRSSVDNYGAPLTTVRVPDDTNVRPAMLALGTAFASLATVEFRIYGYGAEAASGSWRIDDVRLVGQAFSSGSAIPTLSFVAASQTTTEGAGTIQVPVRLLNPSATTATTVQVTLAPVPGTATSGADYTFTTQTLTFPAGSSGPRNVALTILDDAQAETYETVVLALTNASTGARIAAPATATITIGDNDGTPLRTIASVTVNDADGVPTSLNTTVRLRGVVTGPNVRAGGYNFALVDNTGGITVFKTGTINGGQNVALGDTIEVTGPITQFRGLTEIEVDTLIVFGQNQPLVTPRVVTTLDETTESELIKLNGPLTLVDPAQWTNSGSGFNVDVTDGTTIYAMRIVSGTDIFGTPAPTLPFRLVGTGGQFDTALPYLEGYQIAPRSLADIQLIGGTLPAVQFAPLTATVQEGAGTIQVPVTISNPSATTATTVQVMLATPAGTATATADYTFATQTLTFPAGSSAAQTAQLTVLNDALPEGAETVRLMLANVTGGGTLDTTAFTLTIAANDTITLRFAATTRTVAEGVGTVLVPVTLVNPSTTQATTVRVALAPAPGTATLGADYIFAPQTLTFPAGSSAAQTAQLIVVNDLLTEGAETVRLMLTNASAGAVADTAAFTLTIGNSDTTTLAFGAATRSVAESVGTVQVPVRLRHPSATSATTVEVAVAAAPGTAANGADYAFATQTLTFAAGDTATRFATLTVTDDAVDENDETAILTLRNASTGAVIQGGVFTLTIRDNDTTLVPTPTLAFGPVAARVTESVGTVRIPVTLRDASATQATTVRVRPAVGSGTATAGADYTFAAQTLTFAAGDTTRQFATLTVIDDAADETDESVVLLLDSANIGAVISSNQLTFVIQDNDTTLAPRVAFGVPTRTVTEGAGTVQLPVVLTNPSATQATTVRVALAPASGTATLGTDYTFAPQTLTFAPGDTAQNAVLTLLNDNRVERTETVFFVLDSLSAGAQAGTPAQLEVLVQDDDSATVRFRAASRTVAETAGAITIPVTLSAPVDTATTTVDVVLATPAGSATSGTDYTFVTQTLTFAPGDTTAQVVNLTVTDDTQQEGDETVVLALTNAAGAALGTPADFTLTIAANDSVAGPLVPPLTTIAAVTANDASGVPVLLGQAVRVRGIVTGPNIRTAGYQTSLQDAGDGIGLFRTASLGTQTIAQGDSLEVIGVVSQFNGLTQITIDSFRTHAVAQRLPVPRPITAIDETTESVLVTFTNGPFTVVTPSQWTNTGSGFTVDITNGTTTYALRIVRGTDVYGTAAPTSPFNLTGIGGQFDSSSPFDAGYQITPRALTDIQLVTGTAADAAATALALYPNPATDRLTIGAAAGATATVCDALGRPVLTVVLPAAGTTTVRVADLLAGVYVVRVGAATRRFVKE